MKMIFMCLNCVVHNFNNFSKWYWFVAVHAQVFTGIAATTLSSFDSSLAAIVSGTIVAAAIINEIIAVIVAKYAFKWAGEIK